MAGMVRGASQWFWDPDIWLPPNVTWESFNSQQVVKEMLVEGTVVREAIIEPGEFARFGDLWYPIPLAVLVMLLRHFVEKYFFKPLGVRLGLKDSVRRGPAENPVLEEAFVRGSWEVDTLAREAGMTRIQVNRPVHSQSRELKRVSEIGVPIVRGECQCSRNDGVVAIPIENKNIYQKKSAEIPRTMSNSTLFAINCSGGTC